MNEIKKILKTTKEFVRKQNKRLMMCKIGESKAFFFKLNAELVRLIITNDRKMKLFFTLNK